MRYTRIAEGGGREEFYQVPLRYLERVHAILNR